MKVPVSWLRDYVAFDLPLAELAERLVLSGLEVDRILTRGAPDQGANHGNFRIGRVVDFGKHPNADRLRLCRVDVGEAEPRQIVCGASNFVVGDTVVVALPGAVLPGSPEPLRQAKLRGEVSDGMMLSERELQLSDEHDGIIRLPDMYEIGSEAGDHFALEEVVLDLEVTANRGDLMCVYGIAREISTLLDTDLAPMPGVAPAATGSRPDVGRGARRHRRLRPLPAVHGARVRRRHGGGVAAAHPPAHRGGGHAADLERRRHHQLRDARHRQPDRTPTTRRRFPATS